MRAFVPALAFFLAVFPAGCGGGGGSSPVTVTIPATPSLCGSSSAAGDYFSTGESYLFVGDLLSGHGFGEEGTRGFVSFDLSTLPDGVQVTSATLRIEQHVLGGDPYPSLGSIVLDQTVYGTVLDAGAYDRSFPANQGFAVLSSDATLGMKEADVTVAVAADRAALRTQSQFRIRFALEVNGNGDGDQALLGAPGQPDDGVFGPGWPVLIVTYQP